MDSKVFLFNEYSQITFLLQLFHKEEDGRTSICFNAKVKLESNVITLSINIPNGSKAQELSNILTKIYKKKDYRISNASIDDQNISLKIDEEIRFTHFNTGKDQYTYSMILKKFYYTYKGIERPKLYRLFTTASTLLNPYLTGLSVRHGKVVGTVSTTYEGACYGMPFFMFRDEHHVYVQTEGDINILLRALSFFFCNPIEYDMEYAYDKEKRSHIRVIATQYNIQSAKRNNTLGYLFSGNACLDYLCDFLSIIKSCNEKSIIGNMTEAYISNYIRAEYLDNISKLLLYSSILEKMANVKIGDETYDVIKDYLHKNRINIEKINDNIEKKKLFDVGGKEIINFVQLRNFFVHHLGSKEAEIFLNESDMLFYLKITITILILNKIGVTEIIFDKNFQSISVFDESVGYGNYIENMLKANEL